MDAVHRINDTSPVSGVGCRGRGLGHCGPRAQGADEASTDGWSNRRPVLLRQHLEVAEQAHCPLVAGGIAPLNLRLGGIVGIAVNSLSGGANARGTNPPVHRQERRTPLRIPGHDAGCGLVSVEEPEERESAGQGTWRHPRGANARNRAGQIILDESQRMPELFRVLRGPIDELRRWGRRSRQFLLLGSVPSAAPRAAGDFELAASDRRSPRVNRVDARPLHPPAGPVLSMP